MKKTLALPLIFLFLAMPYAVALDVNYSDTGFGFQNGSYIYFRDPIVFDDVTQVASTNATFGDYVFFQKAGSEDTYGFYCDGVNVTVNSLFVGDILELDCVGSGSVYVQVADRAAPTSVVGASGAVFDSVNRVVLVSVASSGVVQLIWAAAPGGGGSVGEPTPTPVPTPFDPDATVNPGSSAFEVENIYFGKIQPNSTVIVPLHFTYSGSSVFFESIIFPEPFQGWYVQNANFTSLSYILTSGGANQGAVNLVFAVPEDAVVDSYSGTFTATVVDGFGARHTSAGTISTEASLFGNLDLLGWIRANMLLTGVIVALVAGGVLLLAFSGKRKK